MALTREEIRELVRQEQERLARTKPKDPRPWEEIALPGQLEPEEPYEVLFFCTGRGGGKTRAAAELVNKWARSFPSWGILVGRTADDVRGTMLEGESGLCTMYPDIIYEPSKKRITWPNGSVGHLLYAESPDTLRGPQGHWAWGDEVAAWDDAKHGDTKGTAFNNLTMGIRLKAPEGMNFSPRIVLTSTPKPVQLIIDLLGPDMTGREGVVVRNWSTYDNAANLDPVTLNKLRRDYDGTRNAAQEIYGRLLLDAANALWTTDELDANRIKEEDLPELIKICVGWDPAVTDGEDSDEHGIIVAGMDAQSHAYVLKDASGKMSPDKAAKLVTKLYSKYHANAVIFEKNQGGDFIPALLRSVGNVPNLGVHAKLGKRLRAEPIAARDEQGRIHHVGVFPILESQMTRWDPEDLKQKSPDRVDARVYALQWLFEGEGGVAKVTNRVGFRRR